MHARSSLLHTFRWPISLACAAACSFAILAALSVVAAHLPSFRSAPLFAVLKAVTQATPVQAPPTARTFHNINAEKPETSHNATPAPSALSVVTTTHATDDDTRINPGSTIEPAPTAISITPSSATHAERGTIQASDATSNGNAQAPAKSIAIACPLEVKPEFPQQALDFGIAHGEVLAQLLLARDGHVREVRILRADPQGYFEGAVRHAALQWRCDTADSERVLNVPFVLRLASR